MNRKRLFSCFVNVPDLPKGCFMNTEISSIFQNTVNRDREKYLEELTAFCSIECGSEMKDGVNRVVSLVEDHLRDLGLHTERRPVDEYGDHLIGTTRVDGKQIVLGGHLDTTYTDYSPLPDFHIDGNYAVGPGTSDMKGGIVAFLGALDCLKAADFLKDCPITVLFNSDEERGAPTSRDMFREFVANTRAALFSECGGPNGEIVLARRGKISYRVDVQGAYMHAGVMDSVKRSALLGLSHKIIEFEAMNQEFEGTSVNLGKAWGGTASNTVPGSAVGLLDIRYPKADMESKLRTTVDTICAREHVPGVTARAEETSYRPVWNDPSSNRELVKLAGKISAEDAEVIAEPRAGTADSNWFGSEGVPTLDGLGPIGSGDHSPGEKILIESLYERILFNARLIAAIAEAAPNPNECSVS